MSERGVLSVRKAAEPDLEPCRRVRHEVFVVGQGVPPELEVDGLDPACAHFVARLDARVIGTARLRAVEGSAKAERVAVLEADRGAGAGRALMAVLETE